MRGSGVDDVAGALNQRALGWFGIQGMQKQESPRGIRRVGSWIWTMSQSDESIFS